MGTGGWFPASASERPDARVMDARITTMLQLKQCVFAGAHDAKLATRMGWMRAALFIHKPKHNSRVSHEERLLHGKPLECA